MLSQQESLRLLSTQLRIQRVRQSKLKYLRKQTRSTLQLRLHQARRLRLSVPKKAKKYKGYYGTVTLRLERRQLRLRFMFRTRQLRLRLLRRK